MDRLARRPEPSPKAIALPRPAGLGAALPPLPLTALLLLAALALSACGDQAPAETQGPPPRPVQVTHVALKPLEPEKTFVGVIRARREIDLAFRVAGKATERKVEVGTRVKTGDVIARIDPEDLRLELESAQAELSAAKANLSQTAAEDTRFRALNAKGAASTADLDKKAVAKEEAVGRLERAKRALDLARNRLEYASLVADTDGVVIATSAEPGQVVSVGQTVVRIARLDEKEALVALPETALADARSDLATVTLWAAPDKRYKAHLRELSPQADATSRTYAARFALDDADGKVALGMTATVSLKGRNDGLIARLPLSAVFDKGAGSRVFVVDDKTRTLEPRPVQVVAYTDTEVLIASGLREGEAVVTLGVQTLEPGRVVRTVAAAR